MFLCSYVLMAACKMISFNEQHKSFLTGNILFALCLYFSLSYSGGGGGVLSLSIIAWERCIKFSEFVCALV